MMTARKSVLVFFFAAIALASIGCGRSDLPELGDVEGTVTMDGKPLGGVIIRFFPQSGRAATATTDAEGYYELIYAHGVSGATVGPTTVSFAWPDGEAGSVAIPEKYAGKSELKVDVKPGDNTFDFALESK